jgi:chorismate synthase
MKLITAGESHGPGVLAIIEGLPAGVPVKRERIERELARRREGYGRGPRMALEKDSVEILSGVLHGSSIASPLTILIRNTEWETWRRELYEAEPKAVRAELLPRVPRPGHADYAGAVKYGFSNVRPVIERSSARATAAVVAAGAIFKEFLEGVGIRIGSVVCAVGTEEIDVPEFGSYEELVSKTSGEFRTISEAAHRRFRRVVDEAVAQGTTVGGLVEVMAFGCPPGLGTYTAFDERLDGKIAGALMAIPSVKGVELGNAADVRRAFGRDAMDAFVLEDGTVRRASNRMGGIEGGMTNGEPIRVRLHVKPVPTQKAPLASIDILEKEPRESFYERSDVCVVPAVGVIAEAVLAYVLAREALRQFGGSTYDDFREAFERYTRRIGWRSRE